MEFDLNEVYGNENPFLNHSMKDVEMHDSTSYGRGIFSDSDESSFSLKSAKWEIISDRFIPCWSILE